jgi:hypothetical protein
MNILRISNMNIKNFTDRYLYINCEMNNINAKLELISIILVIITLIIEELIKKIIKYFRH